MSFTIGPWQVDDRTVYALQHHGWRKGVQQFENRFSASVQGAKCLEDELSANAVLMAAAPDLLAALQALVNAADNLDPQSGFPVGYQQLLDAAVVADAAIAKATGGAT